jgi:hypothetical protein
MREIILRLIGAVLIASITSSMAFSKEHHHSFGNANAYASPYYLPEAAPGASGMRAPDVLNCAVRGMYADNDLNVYRDGQCRDDVDAHGG